MSRNAAVQCSKLTKYYDGILAVDRLDLSIPQGRLWGLVGPNGAGKTTTLKMLSGILEPSMGTVLIHGVDMSTDPLQAKTYLGYLPEDPSLFTSLTVREHLDLIGELHSIPRSTFRENREKYLAAFDLQGRRNQYIGSLSKGWLQRTALCGVVLKEPEVLLLDEPFYGLDPPAAYDLKRLLTQLRDSGRTVVVSTNMLDITEKLCDHFTILNRGRRVAEGTLSELLDRTDSSKLEDAFLHLTGRPIT